MEKQSLFIMYTLTAALLLFHMFPHVLRSQPLSNGVASGASEINSGESDRAASPSDGKSGAPPSSDTVTGRFKGYNVCVGCYLARKQGVLHQPEKYGHQPVFRIKSAADEKGNRLTAVEGLYVYYILNDDSYALFAPKYSNKPMLIKGTVHIQERAFEVSAFRPIEPSRPRTDINSGNNFPLTDSASDSAETTEQTTDSDLFDSSKPWYYDRLKAVKGQ